jgi:superfamily I DNA/RNA helicase
MKVQIVNHVTEFRWDDGLDGAARRIAQLDHSPIRVLAGPGTGKTFALMRRVARLLQNGGTANRMLVCTFTRTAARDLEGELSRLGIDGADDVRAGTLHSFCFGLLSRDEVLEITGRVPRPLLKFEERFLLEDLSGDGFEGIRARDRRLQAFNAAWARLQSETPGWPHDPVDQAFHRELVGWLRFHEAMLIGELVPEALRYLRDNPASPHRGVFEHVLVDEYQDLNRAEQVLLDLLVEAGHLIVIGDEDQSIYSFKFAHPEGIATFDGSHPGTHDERLDECRRCPRRVVEMANTLIANNPGRTPRILQPLPGNPEGEVLVLQWRSIEDEAQGIAEIIRRRIRNAEVEPGRVLVLAPRRHLGYAVRDALNALGVYAHSFFHEEALDGDPKRLDESDAQQAFTLLTLLANADDRVALRCWCGLGSSSLRSGAWARLREHCETSGDTPRAALERLASGDLSIPHTAQLVERFRELQRRLAELAPARGEALVDALFPGDQDWTSLIRSLASTIEGDEFDAEELRGILRIGITQPELPTDVDYVRVMSLHKSKGLTADLVIVLGCIEGLVPMVIGDTPAEQAASLEEQRRLFYVAITRTRRILILSSVTQLRRNLAHRMGAEVRGGNRTQARTIASRFLSDLGPSRPAAVVGTVFLETTSD